MKFQLISGKDLGLSYTYYDHYIVLSVHENLKNASNAREIAGDLIFDQNGEIIKDHSWLWKWEQDDPKSYARRSILNNKTLKNAKRLK